MTPSADPGNRLFECTGMKGCSAHQKDSKPNSSTLRAMKPTSTRYAGKGTEIPTFMMTPPRGDRVHHACARPREPEHTLGASPCGQQAPSRAVVIRSPVTR